MFLHTGLGYFLTITCMTEVVTITKTPVARLCRVAQQVERWTCDQHIVNSNPTRAKLHNNLRQVVHTYVPLSPSSITWYRPRGWCTAAGKVTTGLAESNGRDGHDTLKPETETRPRPSPTETETRRLQKHQWHSDAEWRNGYSVGLVINIS